MIELIEGLPDGVVAVRCSGHVTRNDYETVLIPTVEAKLKKHEKLRLLYSIGPGFEGIDPGAVLEDTKIGFEHLHRWERVAVVTNVEWIRLAVRAFAFLLPCPVKFFDVSQLDEARRWIVE